MDSLKEWLGRQDVALMLDPWIFPMGQGLDKIWSILYAGGWVTMDDILNHSSASKGILGGLLLLVSLLLGAWLYRKRHFHLIPATVLVGFWSVMGIVAMAWGQSIIYCVGE